MDFITFYNNHVKEYLELEGDVFNLQKSIYFNLGSNNKYLPNKKTRVLTSKDFLRTYGNSLVYSKDLGDLLCRICRKFEALCRLIIRDTKQGQKIFENVSEENLKIGSFKEIILELWPDITSQKITFKNYTLIPFSNWSPKYKSKLEWWTNHNKIKHNEIKEFRRGNLKNVINALAALNIIECKYLKYLALKYEQNNNIPDSDLGFTPVTSNHFKIKDLNLIVPAVEDIPYHLTQEEINALNRMAALI